MIRTMHGSTVILASTLAACGPNMREEEELDETAAIERHAAAYCAAARACSCLDYHFESAETCRQEVVSRLTRLVEPVEASFDAACLDRYTDAYADDPCAAPEVACSAISIARREGDACQLLETGPLSFGIAPCGEGLTCWDDRCVSVVDLSPRKQGESCWAENSLSCSNPDLYCSSRGTCEFRSGFGEPCEAFACETSSPTNPIVDVCLDGEGGPRCGHPPLIGEPCDPVDSLVCVDPDGTDFARCSYEEGICVVGERPHVCFALERWTAETAG